MNQDGKNAQVMNALDEEQRSTRRGIFALVIGLTGFLLWASIAPLDEGVPTEGVVTIETKRKAVQHLNGGIVKAVYVKEGQVVQEGQILMQLDQAAAKASFETVRQRYLGLRTMQGRLLAEQSGAARIRFHPDLIAAADDPEIKAQMDNQELLLKSRQGALAADLQALEESIAGQRALLESQRAMKTSRETQLRLLQDELRNTTGLVRDGYVPRNRQLELERQMADLQAGLADLMGQTQRALRTIAEFEQRKTARRQEYRKEVETHLSEVTREVQSDVGNFVAVADELERIDIKAPASGQVVGLAVQTVGAVVQPGQNLLDIVPEGEPLLLETRVAPHLIDMVKPGLLTDVRFSTFSHAPQLVVEGRVDSISGDLLNDQATGATYYLARVELTKTGMAGLGGRRIQPGMPAQVIIKTGERSMLTYLLEPLIRRVAASMTEQ